jgi:hypothetical protein
MSESLNKLLNRDDKKKISEREKKEKAVLLALQSRGGPLQKQRKLKLNIDPITQMKIRTHMTDKIKIPIEKIPKLPKKKPKDKKKEIDDNVSIVVNSIKSYKKRRDIFNVGFDDSFKLKKDITTFI